MKLQTLLGDRLLQNEPLARHTAARLGGAADWLYIARDSTDELIEVARTAWEEGIPTRIMGGGANVLVADSGFRGLIIINDITEISFGDWHDGRNVAASGGTSLTVLARKCQSRGLSGLEWAVSVPGTVGGGVVNNAGAHGGNIAASLVEAVVMSATHEGQLMTHAELEYDYRTSSLKRRADRRFLVLMAIFALTPADPPLIQSNMERFIAHRKETQPPGASLGSIFKNPPDDHAGRLIEAAGLKGYSIGGAQVSPVHANFFINANHTTASDYFALIQHVRDVVYQHSGVELELEIEVIGEI